MLGLMLGVVLVAAPRFNRQDVLIGQWTGGKYGANLDSAQYEQMVHFIRGEAPKESLVAPFCYRPITPLLAAPLPARTDPISIYMDKVEQQRPW